MAENLSVIRRRIGSVKNTQQITKAMKMVAAAKLKKAEQRARSFAPYAVEIENTLKALLSRLDDTGEIPLTHSEAEKGRLVLVVAGDRGLCGGFNSGLFKHADKWLKDQDLDDLRFCTVGRRAATFVRKKHKAPEQTIAMLPEPPTLEQLEEIQSWLETPFLAGEIAEAWVIYNRYESPLSQVPTVRKILPFETGQTETETVDDSMVPFLTDVPTPQLVKALVEDGFRAAINTVILDNQAGEHGSRMTAMDSATTNASDMINNLTVRYNRARQAAITNELMDIVNGAESIK